MASKGRSLFENVWQSVCWYIVRL